ncbi:response regulator transcription factor [Salinicoccus luteus]|uniref:response regulator transcription factor n=1 Tax=Salinicoccus luteus TaxID=367840 RepID=UPI0004E21C39|nr:LuxR C-terminal-related transcriptional regulator [Salinicoccus luteus]
MASAIELLEKVQQTFASQYGLTFFLTDREGEVLTSVEGGNGLCGTMLEEGLLNEMKHILKNDGRISRPLIYEVASGVHIMAAPVINGEGTSHYLWAGVLVDQDRDVDMQTEMQGAAPILYENNRSEWLQLAGRIAEVTGLCLQQTDVTPLSGLHLDRLRKSVQQHEAASAELFSQVTEDGGEIEFLGIAEQTGEDTYTVTRIIGREAGALRGKQFIVGEGFLGRTALTEVPGYWEDIGQDRRSRIFASLPERPQLLFTDTAQAHDGSVAVLFGGSFSKKRASASTKTLMQMTSILTESSLLVEGLREENSQQLSRLTSLVEICRLMASTPDPRRMILILLDISINLVEGPFSLVLIKDNKSGKGKLVTRGSYEGEVSQYVRTMMERTRQLSRLPEDTDGEPYVVTLPNGQQAIECPLAYGNEMQGILSVGIDGTSELDLQEHIAFLQTLSIIGGVSLQLAGHRETHVEEEKSEALHLAVQEMDEAAYVRSKEAAELAAVITARLEFPEASARAVVRACQLSHYSSDFIRRMFPENDAASVMETGNAILQHHDIPRTDRTDIAGYIYALCIAYSKSDRLEDAENLPRIDEAALDTFLSLVRTTHVSEVEFDLGGSSKMDDIQEIADAVKRMDHLSPREQEVLTLLAEGKNNQDIAEILYISAHTVKNHITKIFHKLDVSDRVSAISKVYRYLHKH